LITRTIFNDQYRSLSSPLRTNMKASNIDTVCRNWPNNLANILFVEAMK
jgi:hypothetical protein